MTRPGTRPRTKVRTYRVTQPNRHNSQSAGRDVRGGVPAVINRRIEP